MPALQPRSDSSSSSGFTMRPVYIAGLCVIAVIFGGLAMWLALRVHRKRVEARRKQEARQDAIDKGLAFGMEGYNRRPVDMQMHSWGMDKMVSTSVNNYMPSVSQSTPIVTPEKARLPTHPTAIKPGLDPSRQYSSAGPPPPFAPSFSFGGAVPPSSPTRPRTSSHLRESQTGTAVDPQFSENRDSKTLRSFMAMSFGSSHTKRFSVSTSSSVDTTVSTSGTLRKVRQLFEPVLLDELVTHLGEHLRVVQTFDDGWCVVGRGGDKPKSLFNPTPHPNESKIDVELGVVPAWCFLKPVKGLRAERPVRSTSLSVTVKVDEPSRADVISWSNL